MRIPVPAINYLARSMIAIAAVIYATSSFASINCQTSVFLDDNRFNETIKFNPLIKRIYTKEKLDSILRSLKTSDQSSPDGTYNTTSYWNSTLEETGNTTPSYYSGTVISWSTDSNSGGNSLKFETILSKSRLQAYECHQRAGWPSAIDYSPQLSGNQPKISNTPAASVTPKNSARENSSSDMTKLTDTQERMGNEEREAIAIAAQDVPRSSKKILLPDLGGKCLRTVDIREDSDVRGMYWFALENICSEPVKAHWCDIKVCKGTNMAATIAPGGKEKSWTSIYKSGRHPNQLKGVACQVAYKNAPVYKDPQTNKCYSWSHQMQ